MPYTGSSRAPWTDASIMDRSGYKNVLVLGGSYGGARAARLLADNLPKGWRVILVERQSHFNHLYVFPRYTVLPGHEHKAFIPYASLNPPPKPEPAGKAKPKPKPVQHYPEGGHYNWYTYDPTLDPTVYSQYIIPPPRPTPPGPHLILHATVKAIYPAHITLSRSFSEHDLGNSVPYEYMVYALGSCMPPPLLMSPDARQKVEGVGWMVDQASKIRWAKKIVVVGGGALGIQYATDIKAQYPNHHVTLIHSRDRLLPRFREEMHPLILKRLEELGVELILEDRILDPTVTEGKVHTLKGRELECDYLMLCTGQKPNTQLLADSWAAGALSPLTGHVTVLRTMQICPYDLPSVPESDGSPAPAGGAATTSTTASTAPTSTADRKGDDAVQPTSAEKTKEGGKGGEKDKDAHLPRPAHTPWPNIFAVGDAADAFGAIKAGHTAYYQAEVAARNIIRLIKRRSSPTRPNGAAHPTNATATQGGKDVPDEELEEYYPGPPAIKLTVGLREAIVQDGEGISEVECAEDLDAAVMWKTMGVEPGDMWN